MEDRDIVQAIVAKVPVSMPSAVEALFDVPVWVGLGLVGLWAALDAFSERAALARHRCLACGKKCMPARFVAPYIQGNDGQALQELDDLRHLYAHNYAGEADDEYFKWQRHVVEYNVPLPLTCGAIFDGRRPQLELRHLRIYSGTVKGVLERFR